MQKKLLLKDLAKYLAADSKLTEQASEEFIRLFFSTIQDGLNKDGQVKIKGWGTFKVIETSDRTSVDVSTGNRITIDGYKKLTFVPEASLKDIINKPFSSFETVPLNEGYDETADEIIEYIETTDNAAADDAANEGTVVETAFVKQAVEDISTEEETSPTEEKEELVEMEENVIEETSETPSTPNNPTTADAKTGKAYVEPAIAEADKIAESVETNETTQEAVSTEDDEDSMTVGRKEKVEKTEKNATINTSSGLPKNEEELLDKDYVLSLPKKRHGYNWYIWVPLLFCLLIGVGLYCIFQDDVIGDKFPFGRKGKKEQAEMSVEMKPTLTPVDYVDSIFPDTTCVAVTTDTSQTVEPETVKPTQLTDAIKKITPEESATETDTMPVLAPAPVKEVIPSDPYTVQLTDELKQKPLKGITLADTTSYVMVGTMTTHVLMSGETLTSVALFYYGDKRLWPYIVKYNNIGNYNNMSIGYKLKIPYLKNK